MRYIKRSIEAGILEDLKKKMVFIGGPRQCGKTTLANHLFQGHNVTYLNWDFADDRQHILKNQIPRDNEIIIFDEIHKYKHWRQLIKGLYDKYQSLHKIMVTGSASLDHFRKGGDSLLGRYHYHRLHPFTWDEVRDENISVNDLLTFGGFPEPLLSSSWRTLKRWQNERAARVVNDDVRSLENVKEISLMELLVSMLPSRVGSLLSVKSLSEDLSVSFATVDRWLTILENLYYCYRIAPYSSPGSSGVRAIKKEKKLFLWDWSEIEDKGGRFENMVASHLLKYCHFFEDYYGEKMALRFLRDRDAREVDFVVLKNNRPLFGVECKTGEKQISRHIKYFRERTDIPAFYQIHPGKKDYGSESKCRVMPFETFVNLVLVYH